MASFHLARISGFHLRDHVFQETINELFKLFVGHIPAEHLPKRVFGREEAAGRPEEIGEAPAYFWRRFILNWIDSHGNSKLHSS